MEGPNNGYCSSSSSSSGEEDGDAQWRAAIDSIAGTTSYISSLMNGSLSTSKEKSATKYSDPNDDDGHELQKKHQTQQIKHYQIKAQKLLNDILENRIEIVKEPSQFQDDVNTNEGGIRLFKHARPGIVFDHVDEPQPPRGKPRILPGKEIDEKSKKFKKRIHAVAVDGKDVIAAAKDACQKSFARLEAKDAAAKAAAKREEERVEKLKRIRGERWLPSMAKEMMHVKKQR